MTKTKLLYIANALFPQNSANRIQVMNVCEAFSENGVDVTLLAFKSPEFSGNGGLFKRYNIRKKFGLRLLDPPKTYFLRDLRLFFEFRKIHEKYQNVFTRTSLVAFLIKKFFKNMKVVYELHDYRKSLLWKRLFKATFNAVDKMVVISNGLKKELTRRGFDSGKIIVLPDGVNLEKFDIKISKLQARRKLGLPLDKKMVMYTGSLQKWKGVNVLLEAFGKIISENVVLCIVGGSNEEVDAYRSSHADKNIIFTGFQPQNKIPTYLKAADVLILPNTAKEEISSKYTSPLKLFEYMASKRPIIATNLPSIRENVGKNVAVFSKADSSSDLAGKIDYVLSTAKVSGRLAGCALLVVKGFSWKNRSINILDIYGKL